MHSPGEPTPNRARIKILRAKINAGLPIKDSEWLGWQKAPGFAWPKRFKLDKLPKLPAGAAITYWPPPRHPDDKVLENAVERYLEAMGYHDPAEANPAAIYWPAYEGLERGDRCNTCGRIGEVLCRLCSAWEKDLTERKRIRAVVAA